MILLLGYQVFADDAGEQWMHLSLCHLEQQHLGQTVLLLHAALVRIEPSPGRYVSSPDIAAIS
jgi:hypothetical protein